MTIELKQEYWTLGKLIIFSAMAFLYIHHVYQKVIPHLNAHSISFKFHFDACFWF